VEKGNSRQEEQVQRGTSRGGDSAMEDEWRRGEWTGARRASGEERWKRRASGEEGECTGG
jgi:hypothetical protein